MANIFCRFGGLTARIGGHASAVGKLVLRWLAQLGIPR
jgi:hypothetical protein